MNKGCGRCNGLMVMELCMDLLDSAMDSTLLLRRCLICGHLEDEVMRRNRTALPVRVRSRARHKIVVAV